MKGQRLAAGLFTASVMLFAGAQPASASYAPTLSIELQPATADTPAAVTSTVTQPQGDTPNKSIRIHYPSQFGFNPGFAVTGCTSEAEHTDSCPPDSQIGAASAQTVLGTFFGPVYFTSDFRLLIYLRGPGGTLQQKFFGYFQLAADGGVDAVIDNLPNSSATSSTVTLEPGPRSLLLTPAACGTYPIVGYFTSQNGEQARSTAQVRISGCDSQPYIVGVWLTPGKLHWELSDVGSRTKITLQRLTTIHGMQVRRAIWSRSGTAVKGPNSMRFKAKVGRARLRPGQYRFVVSVFSIYGHPNDTSAITFRVK